MAEAPGYQVYRRLPYTMQNLAVTVYGGVLYWRRYGAEHRRWLERLLQSQWYDAERLERETLQALRETVDYAARHVPFYREAYRKAGYRVGDLRTFEDLRSLPVVEKDHVRADPMSFVSETMKGQKLYCGSTSGTTGTPLLIYKNREAYQRNWAFLERVRSWFRVPHRSVRVSLGVRPVVPMDRERPPFWRYDAVGRNWLFSIFHLSPKNLPSYVKKITEIQPVEIDGYPSTIAEVARAVMEAGVTTIRPRVVITTAETLSAEQRELIEQAFGTPPRDQYGSAENVAWISQCLEGTYHVHPEYGYVETVRDDEPVLNEPGQVIATGFLNRAMPLVRYRLGDIVTLTDARMCACGRAFQVVREIVGRTDDVLYAPDGRALPGLDIVFKGLHAIREGQLIQDARDHLRVLIVPDGDSENATQILRTRLTELFGPRMRIDFVMIQRIPRTAAGKFRTQINLVGRPHG